MAATTQPLSETSIDRSFQNAGRDISASTTTNYTFNSPPALVSPPYRYDISPPRIVTTATKPNEVMRNCDVYARLLLPRGHGWPLWNPQLNDRFPVEYQRKGVSIGDVGMVTWDGGFDFLFNICLPEDDPINGNGVPEGFEPLDPPFNPSRDVFTDMYSWDLGSYEANGSLTQLSSTGCDYTFEARAPEGALVLAPHGGSRYDLLNLDLFFRYARTHGEDWYKFINRTLGRRASNGSVYLITGVDKVNSWGTCSFSGVLHDSTLPLHFGVTSSNSSHVHKWHSKANAWTKAGPSGYLNGQPDIFLPQNQCIFLRGVKVALGMGLWKHAMTVEVSSLEEYAFQGPPKKYRFIPFCEESTSTKSLFRSLRTIWDSGSHPHDDLAEREMGENKVMLISDESTLPRVMTAHPLDALNDYLFNKFKDADIIMTHDDVWRTVLPKNSTLLPGGFEMIKLVQNSYVPVCVDGMALWHDTGQSSSESHHSKSVMRVDEQVHQMILPELPSSVSPQALSAFPVRRYRHPAGPRRPHTSLCLPSPPRPLPSPLLTPALRVDYPTQTSDYPSPEPVVLQPLYRKAPSLSPIEAIGLVAPRKSPKSKSKHYPTGPRHLHASLYLPTPPRPLPPPPRPLPPPPRPLLLPPRPLPLPPRPPPLPPLTPAVQFNHSIQTRGYPSPEPMTPQPLNHGAVSLSPVQTIALEASRKSPGGKLKHLGHQEGVPLAPMSPQALSASPARRYRHPTKEFGPSPHTLPPPYTLLPPPPPPPPPPPLQPPSLSSSSLRLLSPSPSLPSSSPRLLSPSPRLPSSSPHNKDTKRIQTSGHPSQRPMARRHLHLSGSLRRLLSQVRFPGKRTFRRSPKPLHDEDSTSGFQTSDYLSPRPMVQQPLTSLTSELSNTSDISGAGHTGQQQQQQQQQF